MSSAPLIDWPLFIGITLVLCGFAAFATGRALAATWRPGYWTAVYCLPLGLVDRFLQWSLFGGSLLSPAGYVIDTAALMVIALASYRATKAGKMVRQYPWLYARSGPFGWRRLPPAAKSPQE